MFYAFLHALSTFGSQHCQRPNFLNFRLANSHLKYSSSYKVCQLNLLREEIRQKKSTLRSLQKEFSSLKVSLQNELNLIDFAHVSTLFFGINDKILKSESSVQQKKFYKLLYKKARLKMILKKLFLTSPSMYFPILKRNSLQKV